MHRPLISIIIPVRNAEETVANAIESVLSQSYANKELIIIDGKSDDGTLSIIQSYNGRIAYSSSEKDTGVYSAINKGLDHSKGEWIYILGADDYLANVEILERVFTNFNSNAKIIFGNVKNEDKENRFVSSLHINSFDSKINWKNTLHQQGVFYKQNVFSSFRFDETLKVLADYDLHLKLHAEDAKFQAVELTIAHCHAQGLSKNFNWKLYSEELRMKRKRLNPIMFLANIPLVIAKYLVKNTFG